MIVVEILNLIAANLFVVFRALILFEGGGFVTAVLALNAVETLLLAVCAVQFSALLVEDVQVVSVVCVVVAAGVVSDSAAVVVVRVLFDIVDV